MTDQMCRACGRYTVAVKGDVCGICRLKVNGWSVGWWERVRWYLVGGLLGVVIVFVLFLFSKWK